MKYPQKPLKTKQNSPSAVFTVPPLLFNFVAFQTLSISAGAIEAARPPGKPESFLKLTNDVGVGCLGCPVFEVGGCVVYSTSIFIRKSWAPLCKSKKTQNQLLDWPSHQHNYRKVYDYMQKRKKITILNEKKKLIITFEFLLSLTSSCSCALPPFLSVRSFNSEIVFVPFPAVVLGGLWFSYLL